MSIPSPLVPAEADLTGYPFMPLDVRRLRDSRIAASSSGEEFRAAVLLWCASWHQLPAASLPDDDIELAQLAGFGRMVKEWKKVKEGALYGWIKCSDGRLYHPVIAEKANEAWGNKYDRPDHAAARSDHARKAAEARWGKKRATAEAMPEHMPEHESGNAQAMPEHMPDDALRGRRTGIGEEHTTAPNPQGDAESGLQAPSEALQSPDQQTGTRTGQLCKQLRAMGIDAAPHMPLWPDLLNRFTDEEIIACAEIAKAKKPGERLHINYLIPMLNDQTAPKQAQQAGGRSKKPSSHAGFDQIDYREGVTADGRF
jgi:hypothetical protein